MSQLLVATECPTCGAPLDVSEGVNTIRCASCRSNLLVTGRKQVLSYYVPPKTTEAAARAAACSGLAGAHVARADLYFIPYYRLTGHDFTWQRRVVEPVCDGDTPRATTVRMLRDEAEEGRALVAAVLTSVRGSTDTLDNGAPQLVDRYIEKSFVARALPELAAYSLGIRAQVLRVGLMRPEKLAAFGKAVPVGIDADAAMVRGLQEPGTRIVARQVLARILSVVYFPYWAVELQQGAQDWLALIDGVSGSVAQPRGPLSLRAALDVAAPGAAPVTVGFRPLVCPSCGWDFPVSADDVVFVCGSCAKAWLLHGIEMTEVPHEVATVSGIDAAVYLPFWRFEAGAWVPAFRYRRLKALADLTTRLSAKPPTYERWTGEPPHVRGCFYDAEDADLLARLVAAGQQRPTAAIAGGRAALVWLPFKRAAHELIDPSTGMALQESLLMPSC